MVTLFTINGKAYEDDVPILRAAVGDVHEWRISASWLEAHVMHLHATPFQVVSLTDRHGYARPFLPGRWMDTLIAPAGGELVVRVRFAFTGRTMFHCHLLPHQGK